MSCQSQDGNILIVDKKMFQTENHYENTICDGEDIYHKMLTYK